MRIVHELPNGILFVCSKNLQVWQTILFMAIMILFITIVYSFTQASLISDVITTAYPIFYSMYMHLIFLNL